MRLLLSRAKILALRASAFAFASDILQFNQSFDSNEGDTPKLLNISRFFNYAYKSGKTALFPSFLGLVLLYKL